MKATDFKEDKAKEILTALLDESEKTYGHERCHAPHGTVKELDRYFYRTLVVTSASVNQTEETSFQISAELSHKDLKALGKAPTEIKVESPNGTELKNMLKVAGSAIKKLETKASDLAGLIVSVESEKKLASKAPELTKSAKELEKFIGQMRKMTVLGEKKTLSIGEDEALKEQGKVQEWLDDATTHLDNVTALLKRVRGWLA